MSGSGFFSITPTEADIYTAVGKWLVQALPAIPDGNVIQAQFNRRSAPTDPYATMLIYNRDRIATNAWTYDGETSRTVFEKAQITMQINVFGLATSNEMEVITTLWRDFFTADFFTADGIPLAPLYASAVRQLGFINGEKQYEDSWTVDLEMEANFTVVLPQQFATTIPIDLIEVDVIT